MRLFIRPVSALLIVLAIGGTSNALPSISPTGNKTKGAAAKKTDPASDLVLGMWQCFFQKLFPGKEFKTNDNVVYRLNSPPEGVGSIMGSTLKKDEHFLLDILAIAPAPIVIDTLPVTIQNAAAKVGIQDAKTFLGNFLGSGNYVQAIGTIVNTGAPGTGETFLIVNYFDGFKPKHSYTGGNPMTPSPPGEIPATQYPTVDSEMVCGPECQPTLLNWDCLTGGDPENPNNRWNSSVHKLQDAMNAAYGQLVSDTIFYGGLVATAGAVVVASTIATGGAGLLIGSEIFASLSAAIGTGATLADKYQEGCNAAWKEFLDDLEQCCLPCEIKKVEASQGKK